MLKEEFRKHTFNDGSQMRVIPHKDGIYSNLEGRNKDGDMWEIIMAWNSPACTNELEYAIFLDSIGCWPISKEGNTEKLREIEKSYNLEPHAFMNEENRNLIHA